jgi:KDO2-lipid IV(A) lauroyltransferase
VKGFFYDFLIFMSRVFGTWFVALFAWVVSSGFFLFRPRVTAANYSFFRSVFPEQSTCSVLGIVWNQFHHFATVFVDRVRLALGKPYHCEVVGMEDFLAHRQQGRGGIFLMSHFGNWEIAARLFARQGIPLMLHLGVKQDEQIEKKQKHDLARDGILVSQASVGAGGSPFDLLESIHLLRKGGFVSIAGDRILRDDQRRVEAEFFGRRVHVPMAPHLLAQKAGVPIFTLFTLRVKRMEYRIILSDPWFVPLTPDREEALRASVNRYLARLEEMVRSHPEHWYRFEPE